MVIDSEWCADWHEACSGRPAIDPTRPSRGTDRVDRGGSVGDSAPSCRSPNRTATRSSFAGLVSVGVALDATPPRDASTARVGIGDRGG